MTEKKPSPSRKELKLRARAKNKKPEFVRPESWRYDRFSLSWRKPRGLDNKIRQKVKGWPPGPSVGYKGPKIARFLHPSGYREVIVYNEDDLANIDVNTQAARIAHTVGKRKRASIIAEAKKHNVKILNVRVSPETEEKAEAETEEEPEVEAEENKVEKQEKKEKKLKQEKKKSAPKEKKAKPKLKPKPKAKAKKGDKK